MAECQNSNERLFGGAVVLEVADGCPDVKPSEDEWKALAAGTTKGFDFNPNTTTSDADDGGGYVETIVTNSDFTISFDGEVRVKDKLDQYGFGRFTKYFHTEVAARRQPGIWVRLDYGPVEFIGYMNITALNSSGGTNDITPFSTEFKVGDSSTIEVNTMTQLAFTTDLTATKTVATGSALNMSVAVDGGGAPYTYVWKKDGTTVSGQSTATFNKASAAAGDAGVYTCVVTDSSLPVQTITSTACTVTVT